MPLKKVNFIKMVHHIKHVDDTDFNFQIYTLFCSGHVTLEELLDATNLCKKLIYERFGLKNMTVRKLLSNKLVVMEEPLIKWL